MLIDCEKLENGEVLSCDICIVGAGAAGITIARSLSSSVNSVCLMESGAFDLDEETQKLYREQTEFNGEEESDSYLYGGRLRYFGGTTNHWAGMCRPLDNIDFKKRDWVNHSGWPIDESELLPFYSETSEILDIKPFTNYQQAGNDCSYDDDIINNKNLCTKVFQFSPPTRFGIKYRSELMKAVDMKLCINANADRIVLHESGNKVETIRFKTLTGIHFTVRAKFFILATGGIENARLLLASNDTHSNGVGNHNDQVGRYFMEHFSYPQAAKIVLTSPFDRNDKFKIDDIEKTVSALGFSESVQENNHLLNASIQIRETNDNLRGITNIGKTFDYFDKLRSGKVNIDKLYYGDLLVIPELNPEPSNRVVLDDEVNSLGAQKAKLTLNLTEQHTYTVEKTIELFSIALAKSASGRLKIKFQKDNPTKRFFPDHHHSGTTRMSDNHKVGVVDSNCKVHGVNNLYIAGSSIFPTNGFANPTYTIVALALRLGHHITKRLQVIG